MKFLIVTPARNEGSRLPSLAGSLAMQELGLIGLWVVVDDGSVDDTSTCLPEQLPFPFEIVRRENQGGLSAGSPFGAWRYGVERGLTRFADADRILKIDADVILDGGHLAALAARSLDIGLIGGVLLETREVNRSDHTRGALKAYNRAALAVISDLPTALGFDVLDEVAIRHAGLQVEVVPEATARVTRITGTSEGLLRGRKRGGKVSRWTGYSPLYFAIRVLRMSVHHPVGAGSLALIYGWVTAGPGPWTAELKQAHRHEQNVRLRLILRNPRRGLADFRSAR